MFVIEYVQFLCVRLVRLSSKCIFPLCSTGVSVIVYMHFFCAALAVPIIVNLHFLCVGLACLSSHMYNSSVLPTGGLLVYMYFCIVLLWNFYHRICTVPLCWTCVRLTSIFCFSVSEFCVCHRICSTLCVRLVFLSSVFFLFARLVCLSSNMFLVLSSRFCLREFTFSLH